MLTTEENELLCRVEGDAPMGQLMRHHWTPVCLIEEVAEADGAPVKARVFGENLVVFRDSEGRVGVLDEACPHRGASLVLGRNEEGGLRCLYHGWKMDADGNVLEMVSEPAASGMVDKAKHRAYPVREWGGMVWGWFGAADAVPEFQPPPWAPTADVRVSIAKVLLPCNWAQILEGAIDSAHSSSLHSSDMVPARVDSAKATDKTWMRPSTDKAPRMQVQPAGYGFRYAALRRPIQNAAANEYVRASVFVAPATALIPPNNLYNVANVNVPMDDTNCGLARRRLARQQDGAEEARLKAEATCGGPAYRPAPPGVPARHQHFGPTVVSCERADLRPTPDGVWVCGSERRGHVRLPTPPVLRYEVIDELHEAQRWKSASRCCTRRSRVSTSNSGARDERPVERNFRAGPAVESQWNQS